VPNLVKKNVRGTIFQRVKIRHFPFTLAVVVITSLHPVIFGKFLSLLQAKELGLYCPVHMPATASTCSFMKQTKISTEMSQLCRVRHEPTVCKIRLAAASLTTIRLIFSASISLSAAKTQFKLL